MDHSVLRNPFSDDELARRLGNVRAEMATRGLEMVLVSTPENIFYLTGLDHWGYFAPHLLIVPADGDMTLVTRAMERVTVANQVRNALFEGHEDGETAADLAIRLLTDRGLARGRAKAALDVAVEAIDDQTGPKPAIGMETWSAGLSFGSGRALRDSLPDVDWQDITGMIDQLRHVKSAEEQALMRRAAVITDAAMEAALGALCDGVAETEVAAECLAAMTRAGGAPPGFGPFIRPAGRLGEEHGSWGSGVYRTGEPVFLEMAGCVDRYHAPNGRLVHIGGIPDANAAMAETCQQAFAAVLGALRPGARARDVYAAWQGVVDDAGLSHYRRHHCGYLVGIGFPPSWSGGNTVTGLRHDSDLEIKEGMTFHVLSWLMGTGQGDYFFSDCVLLGADGAEVLTTTPSAPIVR